ncbi:hypothetical protein TRFO_24346 [Tritrichomonas foetus]|uniref:TOG domain-containing protein n=1 Tax=Tritrichomonas foetus TaxID=1144522 RepID=A0A1J4K7T6_9EUKA|nr:hypothetical protein TRFO_24346 [Tritrichomonas foetus]|eukprot:OHT07447.1 hypothetical protein TRFO_24346 [Tritrichomonas foetus]
MSNRFSKEEIESALHASTWVEKRLFIEHVEELLMDEDEPISNIEVESCLPVLNNFISDENKNLVQRSMKILEALCQNIEKDALNNISSIFHNVFQCINDSRSNIREQSIRTINSLVSKSRVFHLTQCISEAANNFSYEGKFELISLLLTHLDDFTDGDFENVFNFIIHCYEDKNMTIKNKSQEFFKNDQFLTYLQNNFEKLSPSHKKILSTFLEKKLTSQNEALNNSLHIVSHNEPSKKPKEVIYLNTSAFLRKQRQSELKESDGMFLITDVSTFVPFMRRLSLDIRDVFDDEVSDLLLSQQSSYRVFAVDRLREIFESSIKNFENSVDIILRWCSIQFLGFQLNVSQASLNLLIDMFGQCSEKFVLTSKEVKTIMPIILWCTATESEAFKYLMTHLRKYSKEKDFNESLLMSLSLDHLAIITHVFDELKASTNLQSVEGQLKELCVEGKPVISAECNKLLNRLMPLSPRKAQHIKDPVSRLQDYITIIKGSPCDGDDSRNIFGFILDTLEKSPTDVREVRYLLYCLHSFLSEPLFINEINLDDFVRLISALCEFSTTCPVEFMDALLSIGFVVVSIHSNVSIFETLIDFIGRNYETQTRRSFAFQTFTVGIQLISVSQNQTELSQLRAFVKSSMSQFPAKDDLRGILCRTLLSEIVSLEKQQDFEAEMCRTIEEKLLMTTNNNNNLSEIDANMHSISAMATNDDLFEFLGILSRLTRQETRNDAIRELLSFEEKYPSEKIVDIIVKLSPLLGKNIENMKNRYAKQSNSRPSSRNSNRGDDNDLNRSIGSRYSRASPRASPRHTPSVHNSAKKNMSARPSPKSSTAKVRYTGGNW